LIRYTPADWDGHTSVWVACANAIPDADLAAFLDVRPAMLAVWRRTLRAVGVLDWLNRPGAGRVYVIGPVEKILSESPKSASPAEASEATIAYPMPPGA
jgi:hypothetical protein